ncbi:MAG: GspE/PulE family protein [Candidatus Portnoybacteria bacterium]|nr:GspE/PulE family protein [Candidatus Portnoybacteria bacterium]
MANQKVTDEISVAQEKGKKINVPFINLAGKIIPPDILKEISEEAATFYEFVPFSKKGEALLVGMIDPEDLRSRQALNFIAKRKNAEIEIYIITPTDLREILKQYRNIKHEVASALRELQDELQTEEPVEKKAKAEEVIERVMVEAPITKIVAVILRHAQEGRASDIHIEPTENDVKVRFRVDGVLYTSLILPKNIQVAVASRIKILSNLKIDEMRIPQDGRFHSIVNGKKIDFRVSTFPASFGEKVVLRILDPTVGLLSFEQLGLSGHNLAVLKKGIEEPYGMILITGPTGSGKTTTLYAILNVLNDPGVNIVSLEDPIEYNIAGISQSQIKPEIGYTFASGLRSILRQDPDIIMVGEIRDEETADLATHSALTGHIVLSTLHTNNAVGVIPRLIDMGVSSFLIPSSLNLMIAQRLIKRMCEKCRKQIAPEPKIREMIARELEKIPAAAKQEMPQFFKGEVMIWEAKGCKYCSDKGTKGRVAIFEVMNMTPELERIIIEGPTETKLEAEALRQGMITMRQDGFMKVMDGVVSLGEVLGAVEQ